MRLGDLTVVVLEHVAHAPVEDADRPRAEGRAVATRGNTVSSRLHTHDPHAAILDEGPEETDGVGSAAHAGHEDVGQLARELPHLRPRLVADDAVEIADHHGIGMRAQGGAEEVVGGPHVGDPVAQRLVDRVLQRLGAALHRNDAGAEELHAEHVEGLSRDVHAPHVDLAFEAEESGRGGGGHAMLARPRLRDDPALAHALREESLAEHVVDLVRAGVAEVFALEIDPGAAAVIGQPLREVERSGTARIGGEELAQAAPEARVLHRLPVRLLQLDERLHERLGDIASAEPAEMPGRVGQVRGRGIPGRHADTDRAAARKRRTLSGSLMPGRASTPETTSTA